MPWVRPSAPPDVGMPTMGRPAAITIHAATVPTIMVMPRLPMVLACERGSRSWTCDAPYDQPMRQLDLNADVGEGEPQTDESLLALVTSANVAWGLPPGVPPPLWA